MIGKEGLNKHVMETIQKKSKESKAKGQVFYDDDYPEPQREIFIKHVQKPENLSILSEKIKDTFKSMEFAMDQGFSSIENRLQGLDSRMDQAYDKLQNLNSKPLSFIHPPRQETSTVFTQTQNNVEIQAIMSQSNLSSPGSLNSKRVLDALSQA